MSDAHDSDQSPDLDGSGDADGDSPAVLSPAQARIVGVLLEKERTTPADYPMTANAIMRGCNQSTSRNPVVDYDERTITEALTAMKALGLVRFVHSQSNRSTKYRQVVDEAWSLSPAEAAVLCLLMLRGAQTAGELRTRAERLHSFDSVEAVDATLSDLRRRTPAMTLQLERQPGQKEPRWIQLLTGTPSAADLVAIESAQSRPAGRSPVVDEALTRRVDELESEVAALRAALEELVGPIGSPTEGGTT